MKRNQYMSVHRLNTFIKENFHDVVDFWVERGKVRFVRVISRKTGQVYMVKVAGYDVEIGEEKTDPFMKTQVFFIEKADDGDLPENLSKYYDTFLSAFPEHRNRFVVLRNDYLMEDRGICFRICNLPSDGYSNFYLFVELEWFYENLFIVNHEIDRNLTAVEARSQKMFEGFVPMYTNLMREAEKDLAMVQSTWSYAQEQRMLFQKTQKFLISVCTTEYELHHELMDLNNIRPESLTFQDTVKRTYKRKATHEKLTKLRQIHIATIEKLLFFQAIKNHLLLHFLFFLSDITLLLTRFHSHFLELENLVPARERKPLP